MDLFFMLSGFTLYMICHDWSLSGKEAILDFYGKRRLAALCGALTVLLQDGFNAPVQRAVRRRMARKYQN